MRRHRAPQPRGQLGPRLGQQVATTHRCKGKSPGPVALASVKSADQTFYSALFVEPDVFKSPVVINAVFRAARGL